mgnify:FL=1
MSSSKEPGRFPLRLVLLALLAALGAAPPLFGGGRADPDNQRPPEELIEFLLVMEAMENFGDAVDLETSVQNHEIDEAARPSDQEGR